jgi:hypothetical protein
LAVFEIGMFDLAGTDFETGATEWALCKISIHRYSQFIAVIKRVDYCGNSQKSVY